MLSVGLAVDYGAADGQPVPGGARRPAPDVPAAVARTGATAGRTVVFSGLTVAAVLAGLLVFPDPFLRSMGLAGVAVVAVVMAAALTLLPALLALVGRRITPAEPPPARGRRVRPDRPGRAASARCSTALAAAGVMAVLAVPVARAAARPGRRPAAADRHPDPAAARRDRHPLPGPEPARAPSSSSPTPPTDSPARRPRCATGSPPSPHVTDVEVVPAGAGHRAAGGHSTSPADTAAARTPSPRSGRCRRRSTSP